MSTFYDQAWHVNDKCPYIDKDGDGVLNGVDIDDDNDGIPDVDELCFGHETTFGHSNITTNHEFRYIVNDIEEVMVIDIDEIDNSFEIYINNVNILDGSTVTVNGTTALQRAIDVQGGDQVALKQAFKVDLDFVDSNDARQPTINRVNSPWMPRETGDLPRVRIIIDKEGDVRLFATAVYESSHSMYNEGLKPVQVRGYTSDGLPGELVQLKRGLLLKHNLISIVSTDESGVEEIIGSFRALVPCPDIDNDGLANHLDVDSDGDGCSDAYEAGATFNTTPDFQFSNSTVGANGLSDLVEMIPDKGYVNYEPIFNYDNTTYDHCIITDFDNDEVPYTIDIDDDNDGVLDVVEQEFFVDRLVTGGGLGWTTSGNVEVFDGDFVFSAYDLPTTGVISQTHNIIEGERGILKFAYRSNTNGGIPASCNVLVNGVLLTTVSSTSGSFTTFIDTLENFTSPLTISFQDATSNTNGRDLFLNQFSFQTSIDTDGDGMPNHNDLDSDGDGCSDAFEAGATTNTTADYQFPTTNVGTNGLVDALETTADNGTINYTPYQDYINLIDGYCSPVDYDNDGIPYTVDIDDDNDGVLDEFENQFFTNGDISSGSAGWAFSGNVMVENNSLVFSSGDTPPNGVVSQTKEVIDGSSGILSFDYRSNANNNYTGCRVLINGTEIGHVKTSSVGYRTFTAQLKNLSSPLTISIADITANTAGRDLFIDNISFVTSLDTDNDGEANHMDLDTDADGCSDALEAGATANTTANFQFPSANVGTNGLSDGLETTADNGVINYTPINNYNDVPDDFVHSCN
jgi:hypothetical protein